MKISIHLAALFACAVAAALALTAGAQEREDQGKSVSVAEGKLTFTAPKEWVKKEPRVKIIEAELATPAADGDEIDGRLTIMRAGGGVEANIDRWVGQFSQPDGKATRDRTKIEKEKIAEQEVHLVDISGTFADQRGPFSPAVQRKDYRMLGAIIVAEDGDYYVKYYGPRKTVAANEKAFDAFVKSLQVKE